MAQIITQDPKKVAQRLHSYRCVGCQQPGFDAHGKPVGAFFGVVLSRRRRNPRKDVEMVNPMGETILYEGYDTPFVCSRACLHFVKAWPQVPESELLDGVTTMETGRVIDGERIAVLHAQMPDDPVMRSVGARCSPESEAT